MLITDDSFKFLPLMIGQTISPEAIQWQPHRYLDYALHSNRMIRLPRGCGKTSAIINRAMLEADCGKVVGIVTAWMDTMHYIRSIIQQRYRNTHSSTFHPIEVFHRAVRGSGYDILLIDELPDNPQLLMAESLAPLVGGLFSRELSGENDN